MKTTNENRSGAAPSAPKDVAECVRCGARVSVLDATTIYNDPYCAKCAEAALGEIDPAPTESEVKP